MSRRGVSLTRNMLIDGHAGTAIISTIFAGLN